MGSEFVSAPAVVNCNTAKEYAGLIRQALHRNICLLPFDSPHFERQKKPEVETNSTPQCIGQAIVISRPANEKAIIEPSINSLRLSYKIGVSDSLESHICSIFAQFLMKRAECFKIVRKAASDVSVFAYLCKDSDVSFLLTYKQIEGFVPERLVEFLIYFLEDFDKIINFLKIAINSRARAVADAFLRGFDPV